MLLSTMLIDALHAAQLAEAQEAEVAAAEICDRLNKESDILVLLRQTLQEAHDNTSQVFLAPVMQRAARYVDRILPNSQVNFDKDFGLASITRDGLDEGAGELSRGTQEQLAILTRLAFADMLLDEGAPVSLILDDPLVYADDARSDIMTDILSDAALRMQVILLTCRDRAFRHIEGNRISF